MSFGEQDAWLFTTCPACGHRGHRHAIFTKVSSQTRLHGGRPHVKGFGCIIEGCGCTKDQRTNEVMEAKTDV